MKPFLAVDFPTGKKNEQTDCKEFLIAKPALSLTQALDSSCENVEEAIEKSNLPLPVRIVLWVCGVVGALVVVGILSASAGEDGITLGKSYQALPWLFWLGGICLVAWALLCLISARKKKSVLQSEETSQAFNKLDAVCEAILLDLGAPQNSKYIEILSFFCEVKDDTIKVFERGLKSELCDNIGFCIFADAENLYLADARGKYAIPLSTIKAIKSIKKTIRILRWKKNQNFNEGIYKQYKLKKDKNGWILCKYHHILEFEHDNELWGMYFPCYELPVIEELTGLKADIL